jgi:hypothetical protein
VEEDPKTEEMREEVAVGGRGGSSVVVRSCGSRCSGFDRPAWTIREVEKPALRL